MSSKTEISKHSLAKPIRPPSVRQWLIILAVLGVLFYSSLGVELSITSFVLGIPHIFDFFSRLWPPDPSGLVELMFLALETVQMAIIGTLLGVLISFPVSLLAARNVNPSKTVYQVVRLFLNAMRSIPELVFALIFVAAVGLGPFAGMLGLAIGSIGTLGKLFSEAIESIPPQSSEGIRAVGGRGIQIFSFSILPQAMPLITSYTLLIWESNVRAATILGLVGAGGIGFALTNAIRLFRYQELVTILIVIIIMVTIIDRFSGYLRQRLL